MMWASARAAVFEVAHKVGDSELHVGRDRRDSWAASTSSLLGSIQVDFSDRRLSLRLTIGPCVLDLPAVAIGPQSEVGVPDDPA